MSATGNASGQKMLQKLRPLVCAGQVIGWPLWVFTALIAWAGYFTHVAGFGLYGDDVAFIGTALNRPWGEEWAWVNFCFTKWPQGRPLGMGLNLSLLPYLVGKSGGLLALHLFGLVVFATNGYLLARLSNRFLSLAGVYGVAAFYALAPVAVVQAQLVFAYNTQISLLCALLSAFAAIHGRWLWYVAGVVVTTLMGEPASVAALLLPFALTLEWRKRQWMGYPLRTILLWIGSVATVLVLRVRIGDPWGQERVGELFGHPAEVARRALMAAGTGTVTQFKLIGERIMVPWHHVSGESVVVFLAVGSAVTLLFQFGHRLIRPKNSSPVQVPTAPNGAAVKLGSWRVFVAGALVLAGAYASFFRAPWFPGTWSTGFMSGLHCVPSAGGALCIGFAVDRMTLVNWRGAQFALRILLGATLGSLAAFGSIVQQDYCGVWRFQKTFWRAFDQLCEDAGERTFVVVVDRKLPHFRYTDCFSWTSEITPGALYDYNAVVASASDRPARSPLQIPPSVILCAPTLAETISLRDGHFQWKPTDYFMLPKSAEQQPQDGNVIVLERTATGWTRWQGTAAVEGGTLRLKSSQPAVRPPLRPLARYYALASPAGRER
ncbi:hypothetical protein K0B96_03950 [Horticoccus luteus]|uniref:Uncharacterized protein n=1 Tax=Horticoccus luteus TaxID=2862869 RepID=A0A8F9XHW2_9BACT|nr:hypothetical protein [Horticoccus luteus]QYM79780.1 hypothetical protein K0B96_03950 [Horticoccus luteus]